MFRGLDPARQPLRGLHDDDHEGEEDAAQRERAAFLRGLRDQKVSYDAKTVRTLFYQSIFQLEVCRSIPLRLSAPAPDLYRVTSENLYFTDL